MCEKRKKKVSGLSPEVLQVFGITVAQKIVLTVTHSMKNIFHPDSLHEHAGTHMKQKFTKEYLLSLHVIFSDILSFISFLVFYKKKKKSVCQTRKKEKRINIKAKEINNLQWERRAWIDIGDERGKK